MRCANCRHSWFAGGDGGERDFAGQGSAGQDWAGQDWAGQDGAGRDGGRFSDGALNDGVPDDVAAADAAAVAAAYEAPAEAVGIAPSPTEVTPLAQIEEASARANRDPGRDEPSAFAYEVPFRPRRGGLRMWLLAAILFVALAGGIAAAVIAWYGLPDWAGGTRAGFVDRQAGLALDFPAERLDRRRLADGTEFLGARGTVTNTGSAQRIVPPLLIVLRDSRQKIVFSREVTPPRRQLGPGESMTISEALTGVPSAGIAPQVGWKAT